MDDVTVFRWTWDPFQRGSTTRGPVRVIGVLRGDTSTPHEPSFISQNRLQFMDDVTLSGDLQTVEKDIVTIVESCTETGLTIIIIIIIIIIIKGILLQKCWNATVQESNVTCKWSLLATNPCSLKHHLKISELAFMTGKYSDQWLTVSDKKALRTILCWDDCSLASKTRTYNWQIINFKNNKTVNSKRHITNPSIYHCKS